MIHPLQSVPSREQGIVNLPGSYFRIEADPGALRRVRALVRALGGRELALPRWRSDPESAAIYHAGAVAASNYLVTLLDFAVRHLQALGADRLQALQALLPLVRGTLANVERLGIPQALTGPIARGDAQTIAGHVAALRQRAPELLELYRAPGAADDTAGAGAGRPHGSRRLKNCGKSCERSRSRFLVPGEQGGCGLIERLAALVRGSSRRAARAPPAPAWPAPCRA